MDIILLLIGLAALIAGGELLVRGAVGAARRGWCCAALGRLADADRADAGGLWYVGARIKAFRLNLIHQLEAKRAQR